MKLLKSLAVIILQFAFSLNAFSQLNTNVYLNDAKSDMDRGQYFDAIQKLDTYIAVSPIKEAFFYRGVCKYYMNDDIGAEQDLNVAVSIYDPYLSDAFHYRSIVKYRLGDYDGAIRDINQLLLTQETNPKLYMERAFAKLSNQDYNGAISDCNKAQQMQCADGNLFLCKGMAENALNKYDSALVNYNIALKINPKNEDVLIRIGITDASMGNYDKAIEQYNKSLEIDSASTLAYFSRAEAEIKLNRNDSAMDDLNMVIKYDPMNALAYFNKAIMEVNKTQYTKALADFDKVLQLNPKNIQALYNSAKIKATLNDFNGALVDYNKTIELFPYFTEAYYDRGKLKEEMHDFNGAQSDYKLAKIMGDIDHYKDRNQRQRDSTELNKLLALTTNFNSDNKQLADTMSIDLMPIFYIAIKTNNNDNLQAIPLALRNSNEEFANLYLTNKKAPDDTSHAGFNETKKDTSNELVDLLQNAIRKTNAQFFYDAAKDYSKIIDEYPKCDAVYFARAIDLCKEVDMLSLLNGDEEYTSVNKTYRVVKDPKNEKYENALADFNKIIELEPDFSFAYYDRAFVKFKLSDMNGALQDYNKAIQLDPSFADAYYNRGLLYFCLTDKLSACQDFGKAGELGINKAYSLIKICCSKDK